MKFHKSLILSASLIFAIVASACGSSNTTEVGSQQQELQKLLDNNPGEKSGDPCAVLQAEDFFKAIRGHYVAEAVDPNEDLIINQLQATRNSDGTFIDGKNYNMTIYSDGIVINSELGIKAFNFGGDDTFALISSDCEECVGHDAKATMDHTDDASLKSEVVIDRACMANNNQLAVSYYPDYIDPGFPFEGNWYFVLVEIADTNAGEF